MGTRERSKSYCRDFTVSSLDSISLNFIRLLRVVFSIARSFAGGSSMDFSPNHVIILNGVMAMRGRVNPKVPGSNPAKDLPPFFSFLFCFVCLFVLLAFFCFCF